MNPTHIFLSALPWDIPLEVIGGVGLLKGKGPCQDRMSKVVLATNGIEVTTSSSAGLIDSHTFLYEYYLTKFEPKGYTTDLDGPPIVTGAPTIKVVSGRAVWALDSTGGYREGIQPMKEELVALCHEVGHYIRVWLGWP
jgi:hypothetical protein